MLAFGIRYLNGFAAASDPDSHDRAEWPPHPGRIFMALAAAHFQTGADPAEREALLWLEGLPQAPALRAPEAIERAVVTHYVPVNDKAGPSKALLQCAPLARDRQPRTFARSFLEHDTVWLTWTDIDPREVIRRSLQGLCAKVTRIGHSSSLVQMWLAEAGDDIGEPNWVPDEDRATVHLRLAGKGALAELERRYNSEAIETFSALLVAVADDSDTKSQRAARKRLKEDFPDGAPTQLRPELSLYQGYARPAPPEVGAVYSGSIFDPHPVVLTLEAEEGPYDHLDLGCVFAVSQRWREALLSHSSDLSHRVRQLLSGHNRDGRPLEEPHLAFLPLAFVGHPHADGHLLGMGLALPHGLPRDDRREALRGMARVRRLVLGRLGIWRVVPQTAVRPALNLRPEVWTAHPRGATHWSTVTPIAYDRHPKAKDRVAGQTEVAAMIARACTSIGLPEPREVIVTPVSAHLGAPPAYAFPTLRRKDDSARRHTHAILVFDRPVGGPVLLGAGRYRGYGFCRPMHEPEAGLP